MNRKPYEYYATHLLVSLQVAAAAKALGALGFEPPDLDYLVSLRVGLCADRPPLCPLGSVVRSQWLRKHRVLSMQSQDSSALQARNLLFSPLRPVLEMLTISGLHSDDISARMEEMTDSALSAVVIDMFKHYFWNRDLLTREEWEDFLTCRETTNGRRRDRHPNGVDLLQCYLGDPQVALWKCGFTEKVDETAILDGIIRDTYMRLLECRLEPTSLTNSQMTGNYARVALKALEERRNSGAGLADMMQTMHHLALRLRRLPTRRAQELLESYADFEGGGQVIDMPSREEV